MEKALQKEKTTAYYVQPMGYYPMWRLMKGSERIAIFETRAKAITILSKLPR